MHTAPAPAPAPTPAVRSRQNAKRTRRPEAAGTYPPVRLGASTQQGPVSLAIYIYICPVPFSESITIHSSSSTSLLRYQNPRHPNPLSTGAQNNSDFPPCVMVLCPSSIRVFRRPHRAELSRPARADNMNTRDRTNDGLALGADLPCRKFAPLSLGPAKRYGSSPEIACRRPSTGHLASRVAVRSSMY